MSASVSVQLAATFLGHHPAGASPQIATLVGAGKLGRSVPQRYDGAVFFLWVRAWRREMRALVLSCVEAAAFPAGRPSPELAVG